MMTTEGGMVIAWMDRSGVIKHPPPVSHSNRKAQGVQNTCLELDIPQSKPATPYPYSDRVGLEAILLHKPSQELRE